VQLALQSVGHECPRDSDMQQKIGKPVSFSGDEKALVRGDLIFWKGHVGFYAGQGKFLHANAFHMAVAEEPLAEAIKRIRATGSEILDVRRL
jgi:cell wall-associated NlpC family hydrolase